MNKSIQMKMTALASALIASALFLGTASADGFPTKSSKVSFAGLDLSTPAGVTVARERVHQAARELCREVSDYSDRSRESNFVKCVEVAMGGSMPHLDALIVKSNTISKVAMNQTE